MIDPTLRSNIAALLRLAEGASPLPWDNNKWYALYRLNDGSHRDWKPGGIPEGMCADCLCNPESKPVKTITRNGENFHLHASDLDKDELDYRGVIFSAVSGACINQGEIDLKNSDYITAAANLAPQLARLVLQLEQELESRPPILVGHWGETEFTSVLATLTPEQESRLADAVVERVLRKLADGMMMK